MSYLSELKELIRKARAEETRVLIENEYDMDSMEVVAAVGARCAVEFDLADFALNHPVIEAYEEVLLLGKFRKAEPGVTFDVDLERAMSHVKAVADEAADAAAEKEAGDGTV